MNLSLADANANIAGSLDWMILFPIHFNCPCNGLSKPIQEIFTCIKGHRICLGCRNKQSNPLLCTCHHIWIMRMNDEDPQGPFFMDGNNRQQVSMPQQQGSLAQQQGNLTVQDNLAYQSTAAGQGHITTQQGSLIVRQCNVAQPQGSWTLQQPRLAKYQADMSQRPGPSRAQPQRYPIWTLHQRRLANPQAYMSQRPGPSRAQQRNLIQQPFSLVQKPSNLKQQPFSLVRQPSNLVQQPFNLVRQQSNLVQQPSNLALQPSNLVLQPSNLVQQQSNLIQKPSNLVQPSNVVLQQSNLVQQPSNLVQQPSNLVQLPSSLVQQLSNFVQQTPKLVQPLSNLVQQPPNLVQQPSNLVQQPFNLEQSQVYLTIPRSNLVGQENLTIQQDNLTVQRGNSTARRSKSRARRGKSTGQRGKSTGRGSLTVPRGNLTVPRGCLEVPRGYLTVVPRGNFAGQDHLKIQQGNLAEQGNSTAQCSKSRTRRGRPPGKRCNITVPRGNFAQNQINLTGQSYFTVQQINSAEQSNLTAQQDNLIQKQSNVGRSESRGHNDPSIPIGHRIQDLITTDGEKEIVVVEDISQENVVESQIRYSLRSDTTAEALTLQTAINPAYCDSCHYVLEPGECVNGYTCVVAHSICENCKTQKKLTDHCICKLSWLSNSCSEMIRCLRGTEGCPLIVPVTELDSHMKACKYRTISCEKNHDLCNVRIEEYLSHLQLFHPDDLRAVRQKEKNYYLDINVNKTEIQTSYLVDGNRKYLIHSLIKNALLRIWAVVLEPMGTLDILDSFRIGLEFHRTGREHKISWELTVNSPHIDEQTIFHLGRQKNMSSYMLTHFSKETDGINKVTALLWIIDRRLGLR